MDTKDFEKIWALIYDSYSIFSENYLLDKANTISPTGASFYFFRYKPLSKFDLFFYYMHRLFSEDPLYNNPSYYGRTISSNPISFDQFYSERHNAEELYSDNFFFENLNTNYISVNPIRTGKTRSYITYFHTNDYQNIRLIHFYRGCSFYLIPGPYNLRRRKEYSHDHYLADLIRSMVKIYLTHDRYTICGGHNKCSYKLQRENQTSYRNNTTKVNRLNRPKGCPLPSRQ